MDVFPVFYQVVLLVIMIFVGFIAGKSRILGDHGDDIIAKLVFNITLPCLLLTSITGMNMTPEMWRNAIGVMALTVIIHGIQMGVGFASSKALRLSESKSVIHIIHSFKGNTIFIGFPLIDALFPGGEGLLYAALYNLTSNIIMWTIGVMILDKSKKKSVWSNLSKLVNLNTVALLIGLALLIINVDFPNFIKGSVGTIGKATSPLAMIFIGLKFANTRIHEIVKDTSAWVYSFNKLIFMPLIAGVLVFLLNSQGIIEISATARMCVLIQASTPGFAMMIIISKIYNADTNTAVHNFFLSTWWSILTLPLMYYLLSLLFF